MKQKYEDYTEQEFFDLINDIFFPSEEEFKRKDYERRIIALVKHFEKVSEHPAGSDVIFYPASDQEDSPEGILKTVKDWRALNGKPGFKSA